MRYLRLFNESSYSLNPYLEDIINIARDEGYNIETPGGFKSTTGTYDIIVINNINKGVGRSLEDDENLLEIVKNIKNRFESECDEIYISYVFRRHNQRYHRSTIEDATRELRIREDFFGKERNRRIFERIDIELHFN